MPVDRQTDRHTDTMIAILYTTSGVKGNMKLFGRLSFNKNSFALWSILSAHDWRL